MAPQPVARVSRSAFDRKPPHGKACTRCGVCCIATLCDLAQHVFLRAAHPGPCPALIKATKPGEYSCGLVEHAATPELREAALLLTGAGIGCEARFNGEPPDEGFYLKLAKHDHDNADRIAAAWRAWR